MNEYAKAKAQQLEDNAKFIKAIKLLGFEATYFSGVYTVRHNGKYIGRYTASQWLAEFAAALAEHKESNQ